MIDQLIQDVKKQSENTFYDKKFYFSYSSLSKLLWNPVAFYHIYVLGLREEKITPSLLNGKVIHALLLSMDVFNDMFIISSTYSISSFNATYSIAESIIYNNAHLNILNRIWIDGILNVEGDFTLGLPQNNSFENLISIV